MPIVDSAKQVVSFDVAITHQSRPVKTASKQNRNVVVVADDNQVNLARKRVGGFAIFQLAPGRDFYCFTHS
jgi:hypothetical protein